MKRLLLHHGACCQRLDGRTPAEIVYSRKIRVPLSRNFLFSQPIAYKSRGGSLRDGTFLLERGSNTSWVLDEETDRLRLAHHDQISNRPSPTSRTTKAPPPSGSLESTTTPPSPSGPTTARMASSPVSAAAPLVSPLPASPAQADPDATLPMMTGSPAQEVNPTRNRRSQRTRNKKVISDYEDL